MQWNSWLMCLVLTHWGPQEHDLVNVPILLHTLSSLPEDTLAQTAPLILQGLRSCVEEPGPVRSEVMTSPDFWALLRMLAARKDSSQEAFTVLERSIGGSPPAILAENYEAAISLLSDFASASRAATSSNPKVGTTKAGTDDTSASDTG